MLICGVDEAGRGSLLGPLVIAGVSLKRSKIRKLSSMGIRDSKNLLLQQENDFTKKLSSMQMITILLESILKQ